MASILDLMDSSGNVAKGGFLQGMESANKAVMDERKSLSDLALSDANTKRINQATNQSEETFKSNASSRELKSKQAQGLIDSFVGDENFRKLKIEIETRTNQRLLDYIVENPEQFAGELQLEMEVKRSTNEKTVFDNANAKFNRTNNAAITSLDQFFNGFSQGGDPNADLAAANENYLSMVPGGISLYEKLGINADTELTKGDITRIEKIYSSFNFAAVKAAKIAAEAAELKFQREKEIAMLEKGSPNPSSFSIPTENQKDDVKAYVDDNLSSEDFEASSMFQAGIFDGSDSDSKNNIVTYVANTEEALIANQMATSRLEARKMAYDQVITYLKSQDPNERTFTNSDINKLTSMATQSALTPKQKNALESMSPEEFQFFKNL
jgi:hypothetical protein